MTKPWLNFICNWIILNLTGKHLEGWYFTNWIRYLNFKKHVKECASDMLLVSCERANFLQNSAYKKLETGSWFTSSAFAGRRQPQNCGPDLNLFLSLYVCKRCLLVQNKFLEYQILIGPEARGRSWVIYLRSYLVLEVWEGERLEVTPNIVLDQVLPPF